LQEKGVAPRLKACIGVGVEYKYRLPNIEVANLDFVSFLCRDSLQSFNQLEVLFFDFPVCLRVSRGYVRWFDAILIQCCLELRDEFTEPVLPSQALSTTPQV
jgi:hypothetical protein